MSDDQVQAPSGDVQVFLVEGFMTQAHLLLIGHRTSVSECGSGLHSFSC